MTKKCEKNKIKKIISWTVTVILSVSFLFVLVCLGFVCIQTMQGKETNLFGYRLFYILTDSMSPTLEKGEMILSKQIDSTSDYNAIDSIVNIDDIVTFSQTVNGKTITNTHRIIKDVYFDSAKNCYCIVTKGDNPNATIDAPIPIANLQAKMIKKVSTLSDLYEFFRSTSGIACMIVIPMALMLISLVYQLVLKIKNPVKNNEEDNTDKSSKNENNRQMKEEREREIAQKAVEEYIALEQKKKEIAEKAIEEYLNNKGKD